MEERGFIRDMLDVKVLILFVAATAKYPLTLQKIYELCYQDDRLSYFDVSIAVPQMVLQCRRWLRADILSSWRTRRM